MDKYGKEEWRKKFPRNAKKDESTSNIITTNDGVFWYCRTVPITIEANNNSYQTTLLLTKLFSKGKEEWKV